MDAAEMILEGFRRGAVLMLLAAIVPLGLGLLVAWRRRPARVTVDYRATAVPFSEAERRFLATLDGAVGESHRVFAKMRVADLLSVGLVDGRAAWQRAFNRISAKHVDFVVCRRDSLEVVAAVELDDRSHASVARQQRDAFLDRAFASAGVRLVRVPVRSSYDGAGVRTLILGAAPPASEPAAELACAGADDRGDRTCHVCGSPMVLRRSTRGADGVQEYFVCTNTVRCHARVAVRGGVPAVT